MTQECLKQILPEQLKAKYPVGKWDQVGELQLFDQSEFTDTDLEAASLDKTGYVYIPNKCKNRPHGAGCFVTTVLHGCMEGKSYINEDGDVYGDQFVKATGYLEYAASNDLIMLFPQAYAGTNNEAGCWDYKGFTGKTTYYTNKGV